MATRLPYILPFVACAAWIGACSGGSESGTEPVGSQQDAATDGPATCDAMPSGMECIDACDGHMYWPSCVNGEWKCMGNTTKADCPDASPCGPLPGPLDCADPCTGQMYSPTCEDGGWGCRHTVPDGGCAPEGGDGGNFPCGSTNCVIGLEYCHLPPMPGNCPTPDSGICPVGCPGCPAADPNCDAIPSECSNSATCNCLLQSVCGSLGTGICQPGTGGITLICGSV